MNLPPFVYAKAFWEALSLAVAGVLAMLAYFGHVDPEWAVPATVILAWLLAFLRMFGIQPELMAKALESRLNRAERLLQESQRLRNDLLDESQKASVVKIKKGK